MSPEFLALQVLNGLTFAALLFLVASGFTLVFGVMRIVNLAHGALYLLGGSIGISVAAVTGSWVLGVVAAGFSVGLVGLFSERVLLHRVRGRELPEVLLTVGIALVIADLILAVFGGNPRSADPPPPLVGGTPIGPVTYPTYRLFVIAFAVAVGVILAVVQQRTRIGAVLRAGVDDREMVSAMGIDVDRVFAGMFFVGSVLAGTAGMIAAGLLTIGPGADTEILLFALVVVIVGGLGSIGGAALGSVLIGLIDAFSRVWLPELSYFAVFAPWRSSSSCVPRACSVARRDRPTGPPPRHRWGDRRGPGRAVRPPDLSRDAAVARVRRRDCWRPASTSSPARAGSCPSGMPGSRRVPPTPSRGVRPRASARRSSSGWRSSVTLAVSAVYALTTMRTRGIVFLMITLALGIVVYGLALKLSTITGGQNGLTGIDRPALLASPTAFYLLTVVAFVLAVAFRAIVARSPFGLVLRGTRESESRMSSLGYSVSKAKFLAVMLSGLLAGSAGVLIVWQAEFISPNVASFSRSAMAVVMVILGGTGTLLGPLIGAGVVVGTEHWLSSYVERWPTLLGLVFIAVVLFAPGGVVGAVTRWRQGEVRGRQDAEPGARAATPSLLEDQAVVGAADGRPSEPQ